jgi:uncharacterized protein YkwD
MPVSLHRPLSRRGRLVAALTAGALTLTLAGQAASAATPSPATAAADAKAVYNLINKERAAHAERQLRWRDSLASVAHKHNLLMAKYNELTHRLPGEPTFGAEVTAAGYRWRSVGENIGFNSDWSRAGVLTLERLMYNEKPPNDAHRRNILNRAFWAVGVDVYMDAKHHKAWLTEVFAQPA